MRDEAAPAEAMRAREHDRVMQRLQADRALVLLQELLRDGGVDAADAATPGAQAAAAEPASRCGTAAVRAAGCAMLR